MLVLVLAMALAQTTDTPAPSPSMSPAQAASATPPAGPALPRSGINPGGPMIPYRGRMPAGALHVEPNDIVIRNSGSTNVAGYTIVVHPDDSADVSIEGSVTHGTVGAPQAKWLRGLIAATPLDQLPAGHCMKSASFGSTTTVTADNVTSPDLSCPGGPQARELLRTAGVIVNQLHVAPPTGGRRLHLL